MRSFQIASIASAKKSGVSRSSPQALQFFFAIHYFESMEPVPGFWWNFVREVRFGQALSLPVPCSVPFRVMVPSGV